MVYSTSNEQGYNFRIWGTNWIPKDYEGLILIQKPFPKEQTDLNSKSGYKSKYSRFAANKNRQDLSPISLDGEPQELFAVIDLETTGLDIRKDSILEIDVILGNYTEIIEKKSSLIKGESKYPKRLLALLV